MRRLLYGLVLLAFGLAAWAGPVASVAVPPPDGLLPASVTADGEARFVARQADDGTVSPTAVVATFPRHGGTLRVAVDADVAEADVPSCVRIDLTGAGKFTEAMRIPMNLAIAHEGHYDGAFGPQALETMVDGVRTSVTVRGTYHFSESGQRMTVFLGTALEGTCAFGGAEYRLRVIDGNADLFVGDRAIRQADRFGGFASGDRVQVDQPGGVVSEGLYGQPLLVDGVWYRVALSPDRQTVSATKLNLQFGRLAVPHLAWSAVLVGEQFVLDLRGNRREVTLPVDRYTVASYRETAPVPFGPPATLTRGPGGTTIEVKPDALTVGALGTPLTASVRTEWDAAAREVTFYSSLRDAAGVEVTLDLGDDRKWDNAAEFEVVGPDGQVVHRDTFEHG